MANPSLFNWNISLPPESLYKHSPLTRGLHLTLKTCFDEDGLELTQTGRLKRKYVDPLVRSFDWPHYDIGELYAVSKVMNADNFPPLILIHELLQHHKLVRHYKKSMRLTKTGQKLREDIQALYKLVIPSYLFDVDHMAFSRMNEAPLGHWDIWINVLHLAADSPARLDKLYAELYGPTDNINALESQKALYGFYNGVIEPLILSGLLQENRAANDGVEACLISKTPIWSLMENH
jgi:hypothetical protein